MTKAAAFRLLCLALMAVLTACRERSDGQQHALPPPSVVVAPVERIDINPGLEYVAETVAVDAVDLRARVDAFLVRRAFIEGEDVAAGALLFELEHEPFEAAVAAAAAQVAEARAAVVRARRDLERARTLQGQGNLSQQSLDRATADHLQAEALVDRSEADLRQARINLGYTTITAPFNGRIGRSTYSVGQWVGPDSGVLARLVRLDPMYVVFNVSERRYLDYRLGSVDAGSTGRTPPFLPRLRLANGAGYPHPGRLTFVDNAVDPGTGTIAVRAEFPNPDGILVPGLFTTLILEQQQPQPALMVPQAAVQEDQAGRFVLVVGDGDVVTVRHVETGARIGIRWEITAGLTEGERVVWEGLQKVRPGTAVAPVLRTPGDPAG